MDRRLLRASLLAIALIPALRVKTRGVAAAVKIFERRTGEDKPRKAEKKDLGERL